VLGYEYLALMSLSTILHLYCYTLFYCWRTLENINLYIS